MSQIPISLCAIGGESYCSWHGSSNVSPTVFFNLYELEVDVLIWRVSRASLLDLGGHPCEWMAHSRERSYGCAVHDGTFPCR